MPMVTLPDGGTAELAIDDLVIAGWAGRDREAVEHHIRELEAIGVRRPSTVPCFYRVGANLLTTAPRVQMLGPDSSGEAEIVVLSDADGRHWVGVASDHTDRKVEAYSVAVSKQACAKPMAPEVWPLDEVIGGWDDLELTSHAVIDGERVLYQEGKVAGLLPVETLIETFTGGDRRLPPRTAMLCGTLAAIGGVRPGTAFEMALTDPARGRTIRHRYEVEVLPIVE